MKRRRQEAGSEVTAVKPDLLQRCRVDYRKCVWQTKSRARTSARSSKAIENKPVREVEWTRQVGAEDSNDELLPEARKERSQKGKGCWIWHPRFW